MRAGFDVLAAADADAVAISVLRANLAERKYPGLRPLRHAIACDLTMFGPEQLANRIGGKSVDVIVGGPPCQGFSTARQVDGANHGARLKADPRRRLYKDFLRHVDFFQPKIFVLENVLGLRSAAGGKYFTSLQREARELGRLAGRPGYRVHSQIEDAWKLGVPQKRRRQLIVGVRNDLLGYFLPQLEPTSNATPRISLEAAIGDLPRLQAGQGTHIRNYDKALRKKHLKKEGKLGKRYLFRILEVTRAQRLTNHVARPHNERDLRDFSRLREGETSASAMRNRGARFEFPYDKKNFKDRYTRQSRKRPCSTIVAHLSKDGLMFIHPTQRRSLTAREAARIQSFPDWFEFPEARTHAFRLIGNAVPPLVGEAVGEAVKRFFDRVRFSKAGSRVQMKGVKYAPRGSAENEISQRLTRLAKVPSNNGAAANEVVRLARLDRRSLRALTKDEFLCGWIAILYLFRDLHPDNAVEHGHQVATLPLSNGSLGNVDKIFARRYSRTGWPVALRLVGQEAWRRYKNGELSVDELYCDEADTAGINM